MADVIKIRIGVVVLDSENRILLARQNKRPFWVLPGGTLEHGETLGACAVREIKEEANLDIALGPLLWVADFFALDGRQVVDMAFYATLLGGTLTMEQSENLDDIGFFSRSEAATMALKPEKLFAQIFQSWDSQAWVPGGYLQA